MGATQQSQVGPYLPETFGSDSFDDNEFSSCNNKREVLAKFLIYKQEFEGNYSDTKAKLVFADRGALDKFLAKVKIYLSEVVKKGTKDQFLNQTEIGYVINCISMVQDVAANLLVLNNIINQSDFAACTSDDIEYMVPCAIFYGKFVATPLSELFSGVAPHDHEHIKTAFIAVSDMDVDSLTRTLEDKSEMRQATENMEVADTDDKSMRKSSIIFGGDKGNRVFLKYAGWEQHASAIFEAVRIHTLDMLSTVTLGTIKSLMSDAASLPRDEYDPNFAYLKVGVVTKKDHLVLRVKQPKVFRLHLKRKNEIFSDKTADFVILNNYSDAMDRVETKQSELLENVTEELELPQVVSITADFPELLPSFERFCKASHMEENLWFYLKTTNIDKLTGEPKELTPKQKDEIMVTHVLTGSAKELNVDHGKRRELTRGYARILDNCGIDGIDFRQTCSFLSNPGGVGFDSTKRKQLHALTTTGLEGGPSVWAGLDVEGANEQAYRLLGQTFDIWVSKLMEIKTQWQQAQDEEAAKGWARKLGDFFNWD